MKQKTVSRFIRWAMILMGLIGLFVYGFLFPFYGADLAARYPEMAWRYWPWLLFLWGSAIPCFAVLILGWRMAGAIGENRSFTGKNALRLKKAAICCAADSAYFFLGNAALLFLNASHPGIALFSLAPVLAWVAAAMVFGALSHLVGKAAALQEQSDLTI